MPFPMTRGAKTVNANSKSKPLRRRKPRARAAGKFARNPAKKAREAKKSGKDAKKVKKVKKDKQKGHKAKKSKKEAPVAIETSEFTESSFTRSEKGRSNIAQKLQQIHELDLKTFPDRPVFTPEGVCRMKFQGSEKFSWSMIVEASGKAMEALYLSRML